MGSISFPSRKSKNRVFSHDVSAAILVSQNNKTAAMLVFQTSPVGVELFSYANAFFCSNKLWVIADDEIMVCRKVLLLTMVTKSSLPRSCCLVTQRSLGRSVALRAKNGFVGGYSKRGGYASVNLAIMWHFSTSKY